MGNTYHALWIHLIWATKNRQPLITSTLKLPLYQKMREICYDKEYHIDFINGTNDHVHLLLSLNPKFSISEVVKNIKGLTWKWANEEGSNEEYFEWQDGYAVISVSPSNVYKVRNYIRNQEKHHQQMSCEEELKRLKEVSQFVTVP